MIQNRSFRFYAAEKLTFIYIILTTLIVIILSPEKMAMNNLLRVRLIIVSFIILLAYINTIKNWWVIRFPDLRLLELCWCIGILRHLI